MKPILFGGSVRAPIDFTHSIPFWSAHNGVPSGLIRQVKPLLPACSSRGLPSCIIMIAALLTIGSGAAVLTFARYSGSEVGTSAVGYWCCAAVQPPMTEAATKQRIETRYPSRISFHIALPPVVVFVLFNGRSWHPPRR